MQWIGGVVALLITLVALAMGRAGPRKPPVPGVVIDE
jgi:hypothetical protein